ncbi:MAG: PLP-dependent transferase, partial [Promicromonosporaceae bacterium]|nr:PLP-dependent transferase [Promicromonosporaceae bacterium]
VYTRWDTDSWHGFEEALGKLEHARLPALVFASGMAAVSACFSLLPAEPQLGRKPVIVVPRHAYHASLVLAADLESRYGAEVRKVDIADTAQVIAALEGADLALIESPTNPMLEIADLPAVLAAARETGTLTVVDNTFATPLGQNPLDLGADVVLHSVTKFLSGHSDVVLGAVVTNDPKVRARLLSYRTHYGAVAGPMEVWLALRGLRTLALRLERAQANATELAQRLAAHPGVAEVRHPSLESDPGHRRAASQMRGFGAIIGLRPRGGVEAAERLVRATRLWVPATSLGGVESTLERRRRWGSEAKSVPEDFLRLSVGIEDVEDLWEDLDQALSS